MSKKPYYTLIERCWDDAWYPQYGSYDRADCVDELQAYRDAGSKRCNLKIIKTPAGQSYIDAALADLNKK